LNRNRGLAALIRCDKCARTQQMKLKNTLRWLMGKEQITHLGLEYNLDNVQELAAV